MKIVERMLLRGREYPEAGCDAYDAVPDAVLEYDNLPVSHFATDALYTQGAGSRERSPTAAKAEPAAAAEESGAAALQAQLEPA